MKFAALNPQGKCCVIKEYESADVSSAGIILEHDDNTSAGRVLGTIVEAGTESKFTDAIGKLVFFRRYSVNELKYIDQNGEQTVIIVEDDDILCLPKVAN
jgi:co-chaperonin GroES (HSP10)